MNENTLLYSISLFFKKTLYHASHKPKTYAFGIAFSIIIVSYVFFLSQPQVKETVVAERGEVKQTVGVTGSVQASRDANLAFQTLGVVSYVGVKIGDVVSQGKILATLDGGDAQANLLSAQAQVENAKATLALLEQGARKEELAIKEQTVANAKESLSQAYTAIPDAIRNVDATTADVIKNKLSSLFTNVGDHYVLSFSSCDQGFQSQIEYDRTTIENTLAEFQKKSSIITTISREAEIDAVFEQAYNATVLTNSLINSVSKLLLLPCSIGNTSLNDTRTTLSSVRTTMTTLFADITSKRTTLLTAKNALSQAVRDYDFTKSGTDPYKIKAQNALVSSAEATLAQARATLQKTIIAAPFSGTISDVAISPGETVTSGKTVISMLAIDALEVEAKVPEIDIAKIKLHQDVSITLDAYGKAVTFPATVTRINPTATTEGSVPMYKVVVTFVGKDSRIKSGMTANVSIITESKLNVLQLPARFIEIIDARNGRVTIIKNGEEKKVAVTLGIRTDDGSIEILKGLTDGDVVVAPTVGARQAQKENN